MNDTNNPPPASDRDIPADHTPPEEEPRQIADYTDGDAGSYDAAEVQSALENVTAAKAETPPGLLVRGILLSLLVIPLGAAAWVVLWNMGFIASIVSFGITAGAVILYRIGSRHGVNRTAFWALMLVSATAIVVSFFSGIAADYAKVMDMDTAAALTSEEFWAGYWLNIFDNPALWDAYTVDILLTLLFTTLGCFSVVRGLAREARP